MDSGTVVNFLRYAIPLHTRLRSCAYPAESLVRGKVEKIKGLPADSGGPK